jgi:hypothetical protein
MAAIVPLLEFATSAPYAGTTTCARPAKLKGQQSMTSLTPSSRLLHPFPDTAEVVVAAMEETVVDGNDPFPLFSLFLLFITIIFIY